MTAAELAALQARLVEDAWRALSVEPEEAGESGADQGYVSDLAVDCDAGTLLRVLARGLLAAGWRPSAYPIELQDVAMPDCAVCGASYLHHVNTGAHAYTVPSAWLFRPRDITPALENGAPPP